MNLETKKSMCTSYLSLADGEFTLDKFLCKSMTMTINSEAKFVCSPAAKLTGARKQPGPLSTCTYSNGISQFAHCGFNTGNEAYCPYMEGDISEESVSAMADYFAGGDDCNM